MSDHPDRRREQRVQLTTRLLGQVMTLDEPVAVEQMSPGGMTLRTRSPLPRQDIHEFHVWFGDELTELYGVVRHSRIELRNDEVSYITGIQFAESQDDVLGRVRDLLEASSEAPAA